MQVSLGSLTVDDEYRSIIAHFYDKHRKLATRFDIKWHVTQYGMIISDFMRQEWEVCELCHPEQVETTSSPMYTARVMKR
jgi:hypothetical protein